MTSPALLPSQDAQLSEVFDIVDADKSGTIDTNELFAMVKLIKPGTTKEELLKIFHQIDDSKDRKIQRPEFIDHFKNLFKADTKQEFYDRINTTKMYLERKPALGAIFDKFDGDKSGLLDRGEIFRMVRLCNPNFTNEELNALLKKLDADSNERVDRNEFINYYFNLFRSDNDATFRERLETTFNGRRKVKLQTVFNAYDLNGDGVLSLDEFSLMLKMNGRKFVSPEQILETLIKIDKDKNRKVDFNEWMSYMEGLIAYMDDDRFNKAVKNMLAAAKTPAGTKDRLESKA
jgi:Ca2+-binding EF-hand superfamily protein